MKPSSAFGLVLIVPVLATAGWIIFSSVRALCQNELEPIWKKRAVFLTLAGIALGIWLAFFWQAERLGPIRLEGFPVPTTILRFEEEQWKNFSPPAPMQIMGRAANILAGLAAALLPVKIAVFLRQLKAAGKQP